MFSNQARSQDAAKAARYASIVLLLTSVHHAYGGYIYNTPWRYHAIPVAGATTLVILGALALMRSNASALLRTAAKLVFVLTTVTIAVLIFGAFEGLYNHVIKNLLYFGGASARLMARLFPPPVYEMPDDVLFEITGILQVVPATVAARYLFQMLHRRRKAHTATVHAGTAIGRRALVSVWGEAVNLPDPDRLVHLQFRRFAGCPVCNLHLRSFVRRRDEIAAMGIREVIVFHSNQADLRHHEADLPVAVIADPDKRLYTEFGVEASGRALLDPRVWFSIARAVLYSLREVVRGRQPVPPIKPKGGSLGLPADFLIGPDGCVLAGKYGAHADDQWSVDEVLDLARNRRQTAEAASSDGRPASSSTANTVREVA